MDVLKRLGIQIKRFLKWIADVLNEHWIWKTIILFLPSIYLPVIVKYAGDKIGLLDKNDKLTHNGVTVTIVLYGTVLIINILSNYKAKRDKENDSLRDVKHEQKIQEYETEIHAYENTMDVYVRLMNVIGNICDAKLGTICSYIETSMNNGQFNKPFNETMDPEKQLKSIAKEMKTCLSEITMPSFNNISVSMAYEFPSINDEIHWVDQQEVAQCMPLSKLKKNKNTTFYKIYSGQSNFLFFNDKEKAAQDGNYVFDKKDKRYRDSGSIICDEIAIQDDNRVIARIILTISTYNCKFTDSTEQDILNNMSDMIESVILQQFEKRIRIELALLYIKKQYNK